VDHLEAGRDLVSLLDRPVDLHRPSVPAIEEHAQRVVEGKGELREIEVVVAAVAFRVGAVAGWQYTGARRAGAAPRWSAWAWPSTMRVIPPMERPTAASASAMSAVPAS
jgi:hypothetical protein